MRKQQRHPLKKTLSAAVALCLAGAGLALSNVAWSQDTSPVRFGVPTWPGVTVQSEVAAQLLDALGYDATQTTTSPAFAITGIRTDQLDVYLGGWMPSESGLINPVVEKGEAEVLTENISGAIAGLAVPQYVWDAGVHSVADLQDHADQFKHKIYGIERGSGFNIAVKKSIKSGRLGLADWHLVASSTSAMLVQVDRAIQHDQWIVFDGWKPHWMNLRYNIKYLKRVGDEGKDSIAEITSNVLTVVNPKLVANHPQVTRFLTQFQVSKPTMSEWILDIHEKRQPDAVATHWIAAHLDTVEHWLTGVETADGEPAMPAIRAAYAPPAGT